MPQNRSVCEALRQILEEAALYEQYTRVISMEPALNEETEDVCALIKECADLRCAGSWLHKAQTPDASEILH